MKSLISKTLVALLLCALAVVSAFAAKVRKERVTFDSDVTVNGTVIKAGQYDIRFNEETGELAILKDGKVKAKTSARVEQRADKAHSTSVRTSTKGDVSELIGVTFEGSNKNVVVGASGGAVSGN